MRAFALGLLLTLLGVLPFGVGASADTRIISLMASTPDISVGTTATVEAIAPGGRATWVYLKNNCAHALHFDLRGKSGSSTNDFPLTLHASEDFQASISLRTVAASADGTAAAACTFTVLFGN